MAHESKRDRYIRLMTASLESDEMKIEHELCLTEEAAKEVVELLKEKPEPHWIPNTKETVPKDPRRKQIQLKNGWIITGWFDGEDWFPVPEVGAVLLFDNVLAWCELPSPYQPEEESE